MSESQIDRRARDANRAGSADTLGAAEWLSLAAAPGFAVMALLAAAHGGGWADMHGSASHDASPLIGMVPMYGLMSLFHSAPWLKLIASRRSPPGGPDRILYRSNFRNCE